MWGKNVDLKWPNGSAGLIYFQVFMPLEFHNLYIYIFFFLRILLYKDQIVRYDFLDLYRF